MKESAEYADELAKLSLNTTNASPLSINNQSKASGIQFGSLSGAAVLNSAISLKGLVYLCRSKDKETSGSR